MILYFIDDWAVSLLLEIHKQELRVHFQNWEPQPVFTNGQKVSQDIYGVGWGEA